MHNILIVDDEEINLEILKNILENLNYKNILTAKSFNEAIEEIETLQWKNKSLSLIITDLIMPIKDGYELIEAFKKYKYFTGTKVFVSTCKNDSKSVINAWKLGVDDYIIKPYDVNVIKAKLKNINL